LILICLAEGWTRKSITQLESHFSASFRLPATDRILNRRARRKDSLGFHLSIESHLYLFRTEANFRYQWPKQAQRRLLRLHKSPARNSPLPLHRRWRPSSIRGPPHRRRLHQLPDKLHRSRVTLQHHQTVRLCRHTFGQAALSTFTCSENRIPCTTRRSPPANPTAHSRARSCDQSTTTGEKKRLRTRTRRKAGRERTSKALPRTTKILSPGHSTLPARSRRTG